MGKDPVGTFRSHHLLISAVMAATVFAGALCFGADEAVLFEKAYDSFLAYQPGKAVEGFDAFIREFPASSALDAAFFWKAKALALAGRVDEARGLIASFGQKFPDSPFRQFTQTALADMKGVVGPSGPRAAEVRLDKNNKSTRALADKVRTLEARLAGLDGENKKMKKSLAELTAAKGAMSRELQEARHKAEELSGKLTAGETAKTEGSAALEEKAALEVRIRELEARLAAAAEDSRRNEEKARLLALERDDALASVRPGEDRLPSVPAAGAVMEREKELREFNEYVRRVRDLEAEKKALQDRWDKYRQEKESELKNLKAQREGSPPQAAAADNQEKALADLRKRLAEAEQKTNETAAREKAAVEEKTRLASRLSDAEQKLAGLTAVRDSAEQEKTRARKAEEERDRLREEMQAAAVRRSTTARNTGEDLAAANNREPAKNITGQERPARLERPVVKVAGKTYSQLQIDEDRAVAAKVLARVPESPAPWHTGNSYDDFVVERVLLARTGKDDLQKLSGEAAALAKKYSFNDQERSYLLRFLAAADQVRKRQAYPGEKDLRAYYESHRAEFLTGKDGKMVQYITLRRNSGDGVSAVQLVSELQREAMSGKPLEEIARARPGKAIYTRSRLADIPSWIREKVKNLREGAVSSIFTEEQFLLLQIVTQQDLRSYKEVKEDIRARLAGKGKDLASWLADIRKEAEDLR